MEELSSTYFGTEFAMIAGTWDADTADPFQAYSVPAFMAVQALESMEQAKKIGQKL